MDREWTEKRTDDLADRVGRFEANVDQRFDRVDARFDHFEDKVDRQFWTLLGVILSIGAATVGKILFG
jgi:hypothetical protein